MAPETTPETSKELENFALVARPVEPGDLDRLHELSISVGWPHRPEDIRLLMSLGGGYVACDEIGRVIGSALWFALDPQTASIGMVITSPRMQSRGAGRWLMDCILRDAGPREIILNATPQGIRLYEQLGFTTLQTGHQHQGESGIPGPAPLPAGHRLRPLTIADLPAITALDQAAAGHNRARLLESLLPLSQGLVLEDAGGRPQGYAMSRVFGRGQLIGPLVAPSDAAAMALAAPLIRAQTGSFLRVDTLVLDGPFADFLTAAGLPVAGTMTHMRRNAAPVPATGPRSYAMAGQALN